MTLVGAEQATERADRGSLMVLTRKKGGIEGRNRGMAVGNQERKVFSFCPKRAFAASLGKNAVSDILGSEHVGYGKPSVKENKNNSLSSISNKNI